MIGHILENDPTAAGVGPSATTADTITFVDSVSVVGDWCELVSDGTSWYVSGQVGADGGATFSNT